MKTTIAMIAVGTLVLATSGGIRSAHADTAQADCQVREKGQLMKDLSGPCTFSQRQGYVDITLKNGGTYSLSPGEKPNHFKDQDGRPLERTATGDRHTYQWPHKQIVVTFGGAAAGGGQAGADEVPADVKDLVNSRFVGGEVDDELMRRGYKQIKSDVQGDEVYSYWKSSQGRCVVVHLNASRHVASVAPALESSCQ